VGGRRVGGGGAGTGARGGGGGRGGPPGGSARGRARSGCGAGRRRRHRARRTCHCDSGQEFAPTHLGTRMFSCHGVPPSIVAQPACGPRRLTRTFVSILSSRRHAANPFGALHAWREVSSVVVGW